MNKQAILNLYRAKLRICHTYGYKYGNWKIIYPNFNFGKVLLKIKNTKFIKNKATYIANYTRFFYKDTKKIKDKKLINYNIDDGFRVLRNYYKYFK